MNHNILNTEAIEVFVIIAETLYKWQSPSTEEGHLVLMEHYKWGAELKENKKIILAGPTNLDIISTAGADPVGLTTGLIMLQVQSREEAQYWAEKDPFHIQGFRKNVVHSLKITMTDKTVFETLLRLKQTV